VRKRGLRHVWLNFTGGEVVKRRSDKQKQSASQGSPTSQSATLMQLEGLLTL